MVLTPNSGPTWRLVLPVQVVCQSDAGWFNWRVRFTVTNPPTLVGSDGEYTLLISQARSPLGRG